jgi:hypothetical protein
LPQCDTHIWRRSARLLLDRIELRDALDGLVGDGRALCAVDIDELAPDMQFETLCTALEIRHRLTPPKSPQTNGMVERFNGRIEDVLQSHHFQSSERLEATLHRYVWFYNQKLPQSALGSKTPLQAMKDWHKLKPELFKKQPFYRPGCDTYYKR